MEEELYVEIAGFWPTFAAACFGGVLAELLKWYRLRESPKFPHYVRSPFYWGITTVMVIAGGALALVYGTDAKSAILVVQAGLSAPLLMSALASASPALENYNPSRSGAGYEMSHGNARAVLAFVAGVR
jgi:hypothetical protein